MTLIFTACAFAATLVLLRLLVHCPIARYFGDTPDHRKVHHGVVPRIGGLGLVMGFLATLGATFFAAPGNGGVSSGFALVAAGVGLFLLAAGTLDDVRPLDFKVKFLLQFALALAVVFLGGQRFVEADLLHLHFHLGAWGQIASVIWIVGVMNAFNMIDGIDGLAGGVAVCALGALAYLGYASGEQDTVVVGLIIIGACLGFLRYNFSRRHKLFLGDTGSQFLGAMLAILAIRIQGIPGTGSPLVPLLIVGYPLLDVGTAMVRRFRKGGRRSLASRILRMFTADNEHLHHRLIYLGLNHLQSTFLLLLVAGGIGATAIIISRIHQVYGLAVLAYVGLANFLILNRLGFIGLRPWLTFPRAKPAPCQIVGVIEPTEVFFHSLEKYKQDKFEFLKLPANLTRFMSEDVAAVVLYNVSSERFEEEWPLALRASEVQDCPSIVIAEAQDIERMRAAKPEGFSSIHFMEKPVRIPDLIRLLDVVIADRRASAKSTNDEANPRQRRFSLAELALRNRTP